MARASEVTINIDGKDITGFTHLSVFQEIFSINRCELVCRPDTLGNFTDAGNAFVIRQADSLIGKKIKIQIQSDKGKTSDIFKGLVTEVEGIHYHDSWSGSIIIRGRTHDFLINAEKKNRFLEKMTLSDVINKVKGESISGNMFDKVTISPRFKGKVQLWTQYKESNYNLMYRLAKRYGEWLLVSGSNEFCFGEPPSGSVNLKQGEDLQEFSYSMKIGQLRVDYTAYDYVKAGMLGKAFKPGSYPDYLGKSVKASGDHFGESDQLYYSASYVQEDHDAIVNADGESRVSSLNVARGTSDNPEVSLGNKVKVSTGGEEAEFRVISISHFCDEGGNYRNKFVGIPASVKIPPGANSGLYPACETQSAIVTNTNDPDKLGRIKVKFFWNNNDVESPWIRVLTPYAGNQRGIFFIPEINDEVLVGFENGNAEKPYVIGAHYHGKDKPDPWQDDKNNKKAIRTRSGHTIEFSDEQGKEQITIYDKDKVNTFLFDPVNKKLVITCKGDLEITAENVKITANKDYTLDVKGKHTSKSVKDTEIKSGANCKVKSTQSMAVEAGTDLKAKGTTAAEFSGMQVTVKGSATTELSAGASTTIKGAIVQIN